MEPMQTLRALTSDPSQHTLRQRMEVRSGEVLGVL